MEDGKVFMQPCSKRSTISQIKQMMCSNPDNKMQADLVKKISFKIPGAGFLTNEDEPLMDIPYFQNCSKRKDDALFVLVMKGSNYQRLIKHDSITIGSLIVRPLAWAQHDDENTAFRQCMARIRFVSSFLYFIAPGYKKREH